MADAHQFKWLLPLDSEGERHDRPTTDVTWTRLDNVVFRDGHLRQRSGIVQVGPMDAMDDSFTSTAGVPNAIAEIWASDTTLAAETLYPNGTGTNNAWTGNHLDIDETVPDDGSTIIESSATGNKQDVQFTNVTASKFTAIDGIVLRGRAQNDTFGAVNVLKFSKSTTQLGDNILITVAGGSDEGETWQDFAIALPIDPTTSKPWAESDVNSLQVTVEHLAGAQEAHEWIRPDANGAHTDWDASATAWQSVDEGIGHGRNSVADSITGGTAANDKQSFSFKNPTSTFSTVTSVTLRAHVALTTKVGTGELQFFTRDGGTDFDVGSPVRIRKTDFSGAGTPIAAGEAWADRDQGIQTIEVTLTQNPADSAAWEAGDLNALEAGLKVVSVSSSNSFRIHAIEAEIQGIVDAATVRITFLQVDVYGRKSADRLLDQLFLTSHSFLQLKSPNTESQAWNDVQGTAGIPTAPHLRKYDWTEHFGKLYFVNGVDQVAYYPTSAASRVFAQLSAKPTGRFIESFKRRIFLFDVVESSTRSQSRLRYAAFESTGDLDFSSATAGDIDVDDGRGEGRGLKKLGDDLLVAYRERGIISCRYRADPDLPIQPISADPNTGCHAHATIRQTINKAGDTVHLFLGENPNGINVFEFDGSTVRPIGDAIKRRLEEDTRASELVNAFAEIDPDNGNYWMWVAEGTDGLPKRAWVYNVATEAWTRASTPAVAVAGIWTITDVTGANTGDVVIEGRKTLIVGKFDSLPYKLDRDSNFDTETVGTDEGVEPHYNAIGGDEVGPSPLNIAVTIETGDMALAGEERNCTVQAVWLAYIDRGIARVTVDASTNGGINFGTSVSDTIGMKNDGMLALTRFDLGADPLQGHRCRVRVRKTADSIGERRSDLDIVALAIEYTAHGVRQ